MRYLPPLQGRTAAVFFLSGISKTWLVAFLFTAVLFAGCAKSSSPVPQEKMVAYYIDLVAMQDSLGKDTESAKKISNILLNRHGISEKECNAALEYYKRTPETWQAFFEEVTKELSNRQTRPIR